MASTHFVDFSASTPIVASWLNDVNDATYGQSGGSAVALQVVTSIAGLRGLAKTKSPNALVTGYYTARDGGGGVYVLDPADTTSADNGGTTIVAADGGRWKLADTTVIRAAQFGVVFDGFTDNTVTFQRLLNYLSTNSARVIFSPGIVVISGVVTKDALKNCVFEGAGGGFLGGNLGTILNFTGSGSNPLVLTNSVGLTFRNISFAYGSTTFSGSLCDFSCTTPASLTNLNFYDCNFLQAAASDTYSAFSLVRLKNVTRVSFMNCVFQKATNAVSGNEGAYNVLSNNSGQVSFFGCEFTLCTNSIAYPGSIWHFRDCNFEPAAGFAPSMIYNAANTYTNNLVIEGCAFVDSNAAGTWINLLSVETVTISNCIFGGNTANNAISFSGGNAINVNGNLFDHCLTGLNFNSTFVHDSGTVTGNHFFGNTTAINGSGNTTNMLINYNKLT